jgi:cytochrome c
MSKKGKDALLVNKILAGILTAGLALWIANRVAAVVTGGEAPKTPAIKIASPQPAATSAAPAAAPAIPPTVALIATADVSKGAAFAQEQCAACHTFTKGGAAGVGPNLYGVIGRPMFAAAGFSYSAGAKSKAKGEWTYESLNDWLDDPMGFAPGTAMAYPGVKNTQTRADVIAYLRSLAASPAPLPSAAEIKAATAPAAAPAATSAAAKPAAPSIDTMFAKADIAKGQALVQEQCSACHTFTKGGAAGVGPNLYGIVGAKTFSHPGFSYSAAVKSKAGGTWTPDMLSAWLADPMGYAPGTMMAYPGVKNEQTRADVIAYLNTLSDSPEKLPGTK